jgi:hypothetical protein
MAREAPRVPRQGALESSLLAAWYGPPQHTSGARPVETRARRT